MLCCESSYLYLCEVYGSHGMTRNITLSWDVAPWIGSNVLDESTTSTTISDE
jgi:hypothetical protein